MNNEIKIFENEQFGSIRTLDENGKIYFCGIDVAKALGYSRPRDAISAHCKGAVKRRSLTNGGEQTLTYITEWTCHNVGRILQNATYVENSRNSLKAVCVI